MKNSNTPHVNLMSLGSNYLFEVNELVVLNIHCHYYIKNIYKIQYTSEN